MEIFDQMLCLYNKFSQLPSIAYDLTISFQEVESEISRQGVRSKMEMSSRRDRYLHIPYQNKIFSKCYIGIRHPTILIPSQHYAPIRPFRCCNQRLSPQIARGSVGSWLPQMEIEYCISGQELVFFTKYRIENYRLKFQHLI